MSDKPIPHSRLVAMRDHEKPTYSTGVHVSMDEVATVASELIVAKVRIRELEAERDQLKAEAYKSNRVIRDAWAERDALRKAVEDALSILTTGFVSDKTWCEVEPILSAALGPKEQAK